MGLISNEAKKKAGQLVFKNFERQTGRFVEDAEDGQIEKFKSFLPALSKAEVICLRAYLNSEIDFYTIDGVLTGTGERHITRWYQLYKHYFDILNEFDSAK